jgi:superfamily II DNA or RNA helicase
MVLEDAKDAVDQGRKVLVLSNSEAEIVNMACLWEMMYGSYQGDLYSDIPEPTLTDIRASVAPVELSKIKVAEFERVVLLLSANTHPTPEEASALQQYQNALMQNRVYKKLGSELAKRQKHFVKGILPDLQTCGIMVHKVPPKIRTKFIQTMPVVFAIMKYGKEGLDSPDLDTVLVSTPFSSRNGLQQLMGRPTRMKEGKKTPTIVFYEDNVGPLMGMCKKLKKHLRDWPHEEGGPFDYENIGHPVGRRGTWETNRARVFGP